MAERVRPPYVLGLVRGASGHEHELILRRDGSVSWRNLWTGRVIDGRNLHEAQDRLRAHREASA